MPEIVASELCAACGLCCDGTLYPSFESEEGDTPELLDNLLSQVSKQDGKVTWSQPCRALVSRTCSIYEERPAVCRRYRCTTLVALEARQIDSNEARQRIQQAKVAQENLENLTGCGGASVQERLRAMRNPDTSPDIALAIGILELMLDRFFRKVGERAFSGTPSTMNADAR